MSKMGNNGARWRVLREAMRTPEAPPRASLPQERRSGTKGTDETVWLPSKPVLPAGVATESRCGLPSRGPGRRYSYRGFATGSLR